MQIKEKVNIELSYLCLLCHKHIMEKKENYACLVESLKKQHES